MNELAQIVGMLLLLLFLMVSCNPQGSGEAVKTFIDAVQGESE